LARAGSDIQDIYLSRTSHPFRWYAENYDRLFTPDFLASLDPRWSTEPSRARFSEVRDCSLLSQLLYVDSTTWLPDDLLVKADKITMASSLELRVPFLDHRVLEFAAQLPDELKVRKDGGKAILRDLCATRIPKELVSRPKAGFPIPYDEWLRGELADFARDVLLSRQALERGMLRRDGIERLLGDHVAHGNLGKEVFMLLVLELWNRAFLDVKAPDAIRQRATNS
jgi:asparagine synthase (glutamine-hydrolysing)